MAAQDNKVLTGAGLAEYTGLIKEYVNERAPARYFSLQQRPWGDGEEIYEADQPTLQEIARYIRDNNNDSSTVKVKLNGDELSNVYLNQQIENGRYDENGNWTYDVVGYHLMLTYADDWERVNFAAYFDVDLNYEDTEWHDYYSGEPERIDGNKVSAYAEFHPEITTVNSGFKSVTETLDFMGKMPDFETTFWKGSFYRGFNYITDKREIVAASLPGYSNEILGKWKVSGDNLKKGHGYFYQQHNSNSPAPAYPGQYNFDYNYNNNLYPQPFYGDTEFLNTINSLVYNVFLFTRMVINGEVEYTSWKTMSNSYGAKIFQPITTTRYLSTDAAKTLAFPIRTLYFADLESCNDYFVSEIEVSLTPFIEVPTLPIDGTTLIEKDGVISTALGGSKVDIAHGDRIFYQDLQGMPQTESISITLSGTSDSDFQDVEQAYVRIETSNGVEFFNAPPQLVVESSTTQRYQVNMAGADATIPNKTVTITEHVYTNYFTRSISVSDNLPNPTKVEIRTEPWTFKYETIDPNFIPVDNSSIQVEDGKLKVTGFVTQQELGQEIAAVGDTVSNLADTVPALDLFKFINWGPHDGYAHSQPLQAVETADADEGLKLLRQGKFVKFTAVTSFPNGFARYWQWGYAIKRGNNYRLATGERIYYPNYSSFYQQFGTATTYFLIGDTLFSVVDGINLGEIVASFLPYSNRTNGYWSTIVEEIDNLWDTKADSSAIPGVATSAQPGLVKPDGSTITIDENGVISSQSGSGAEYTAGVGIAISDENEIGQTFSWQPALIGLLAKLFFPGYGAWGAASSTPSLSTTITNLKRYGISYIGNVAPDWTIEKLAVAMGEEDTGWFSLRFIEVDNGAISTSIHNHTSHSKFSTNIILCYDSYFYDHDSKWTLITAEAFQYLAEQMKFTPGDSGLTSTTIGNAIKELASKIPTDIPEFPADPTTDGSYKLVNTVATDSETGEQTATQSWEEDSSSGGGIEYTAGPGIEISDENKITATNQVMISQLYNSGLGGHTLPYDNIESCNDVETLLRVLKNHRLGRLVNQISVPYASLYELGFRYISSMPSYSLTNPGVTSSEQTIIRNDSTTFTFQRDQVIASEIERIQIYSSLSNARDYVMADLFKALVWRSNYTNISGFRLYQYFDSINESLGARIPDSLVSEDTAPTVNNTINWVYK